MAIDFGEVFESLHNIQTEFDKIMRIANLAKQGKVVVDNVGTFNFTTAQKNALKNEYERLKVNINNYFGELP